MSINQAFAQNRAVKKWLQRQIPYLELLDVEEDPQRSVVENKNGSIFSVYKINIEDDKMDEDTLEDRSSALCQMLSSGFSHNFEFNLDFVRCKKHYDAPLQLSDEKHENANMVLQLRKQNFDREVFFENSLYFSVCYKPDSILKETKKIILTKEILEDFLAKRENVITAFIRCGYRATLLCENALITYLYKSLSNEFEEKDNQLNIAEPSIDLDDFYSRNIDIYPNVYPTVINDKLQVCTCLTALPSTTFPDMISSITEINHNIRFTMKYLSRDKAECDVPIYKQRDKEKSNMFRMKAMFNGSEQKLTDSDELNIEAIHGKQQCDMAIKHIHEADITGGFLMATFITSFETEDKVQAVKNELENIMNRLGVKPSYLWYANVQRYFESVLIGFHSKDGSDDFFYCLADNVADFFPVSSNTFEYHSEHLEEITHSKIPFLYGKTSGDGLYKFSPSGNYGNYGHTFLTGQTGAGKSITLSLMANEWLKYEKTKVVYLDMGLSMLHTVQKNNGKVFYPMVDKTAFCPFKNAKDNVDSILSFIESIAVANNFQIESSEISAIQEILLKNMPYGKEDFGTFYALFKGKVKKSKLTDAFAQYVNVYGNLFNSKDDSFQNLPRICGIELETLLTGQSSKLVYPSLVYIFNQLEKVFKAEEPTLLILDEAWRFLRDDFFASYITKWLKQLRKKNTFVVIATQELNDLISSPLCNTIMTNCYTRIFLADNKATQEINKRYYMQIGLPAHVIDRLATIPRFTQIVSQEDSFFYVSWMMSLDLVHNYLKTPEEEKNKYKREQEKINS